MKFKIKDRFYLNEPRNVNHGKMGTVVNIKTTGNPYEIMMDGDEHALNGKPFTWWAREIELSDMPVPRINPEPLKSTPTIQYKSMDISSGFGVGGAGSDDYSMATEREQFSPQFSPRKSSGQLWQPCAKRGCDNEPVCLDCEYCDAHCHCGE